jgi:protein-L-isoaspartate(D-aspartate) O-methyltransferase
MRPFFSSLVEQQRALVTSLRCKGIASEAVLEAMGRVPRQAFMRPYLRHLAYADRAQPIGFGQTISQPYIVALMSTALCLSGTESVLEIGTGSGYQAAILSVLARSVVSIERFGKLARRARKRLEEMGFDNVTVIEGDGSLGWPARAPYDRVIVTAAAAECPPILFEQLKEGGLLVIPLGTTEGQTLLRIRKTAGQPQIEELCACVFVPLIRGVESENG